MKRCAVCSWAIAGLAIGLQLAPADVRAEDTWGCEVLLCLSNPAGPMAVPQCVPPIKRLYRAIFKWKPDPFPSCAMAQGPNGASWAQVEYNNYYDGCPAGTRALERDAFAIQGTAEQVRQANERRRLGVSTGHGLVNAPMFIGIGEGGSQDVQISEDRGAARKVCVGKYLGNVVLTQPGVSDDAYSPVETGVYDRIVHLDPYVNGFAIRVFLDGRLYRLVRPQF